MKKNACGCGILLILIIIGGFLAWRLWGPPPPIASSVATTPEGRARQKAVARQLRDQVETIHSQARQGAHAPFELRISEEQLNALLAQGVEKGGKFDVQNLAARLEPDLLTLQGTANYHGAPVTLTITGNLALVNSRIQFEAKSLWLGGFPAPEKWRDQASEFVSRQINNAIAKDAGRLDEVKIQSGELIVRGVTR
jgi:hypothetical protein